MRYSIADVNAIDKEAKSLEECCEKLFTDWLTTDHCPEPKTYQTLLNHIKKIGKLFTASKQIEQDLIKGNRIMCEVHTASHIIVCNWA